MDFTSSDFHLHCEGNPSLYKCCSVQWMDEWCEESMKKIPYELLAKDSDKYKIGDDDKSFIDEEFLDNFVKLHKLCEKSIATPRRYMTFVQNFFAVFQSKKLLITKRKDHLQAGVSKLNEARLLVDNLKSKAAEQSKLLAEKQAEADDALKQITSSMSSTSDQKTEMENLKSKIEEENKKIAKRKKEIEKEMAEIEPIVQEAKAAVGNIRSEALSEIRSLRAPPDIIRDILEGVLRLMGIFDTSWVSMKSFLSKRGVKEEIISFDARKITPEIRYSVDQLLSKNHESFDPKNAKRASAAAAPLASWVKANVKYSQVLEKVSPLEKEQAKLQHNLVSAERRINKLSGALEDVEQEVIHLRDKLSKFTKEAAEIEFNLKHSKEIIISAETLVQQLDSEYQRWTKQLGEIDKELTKLPVQSLLAAAFITYLSSSSEDIRQINIEKWCSILGYKSFDLKQFLSNEQEQLTWKTEGLPSDLLSIENAIIILQSTLYPFLIDPSTRATNWLKFHLRNTNIDIVSQQDNNFPTSLELAVRFGKTLIVLDVDTIEPLLYSLLRADLISQGPRYVIQIGEKLVDFNENFKMFLITKYSSLELPPYASALITTVNFSTTKAGLMGQLLAAVLQHEKPELEQRRMQLLEQEEELKLQLTKLEESLLEQLASAQGNILENKELIASLNNTKSSSLNISSALKESQQLQLSLEEERKVYLPLAQFGSNLYFVITELIKLNNMYDFSLSTFFKLFNQALATDKISNSPEDRMKGLIQSLQHLVYEYVCRSLFKTDRLTFAMHLIHGMYTQHFQENEWEAFIGMLITDVKLDKNEMKSLLPDWVEEERALAVTLLKNTFPNLFSSLRINDNNLWNTFAKSYHCEQEIPSIVEQQLTSFQQVLLIQALRPDRLQSAMTTFCSRLLTLKELSLPALNLRNIYSYETLASEPILIIISPGADPSQELQELSAEIVGSEKYYQVSMGQGQMEIAIDYLHNCAQEGNWLCLKNLHLVTHWLPTLIKEFNKLSPHENFRLWLTSEPHPKFSPILLQMSLKLTYEAPPGVKKNLLRTYNSWSQEYVNSGKNMTRSHILFILAWFHAILQERRMYIPQGWTKFYEFNLADLRAGADIIDRIYKNPGSIKINQLEYIHGLYESAIYGGRIDNPFDMRILISYLRQFFNDQVISGSVSMRKHFSCNIQLPNSADYQEYVRAIYQMPEEDSPQYFGLPANIERSIQRISSNQVIQQLKLLMRPSEVENTFDINRWNTELSPILNLWKKLNQGAQLIQLNVKPPTEHDGKYSPLNSFVQLEYYNGIQLVQFIHASLAGLSKVIRGTLLLTKEIQQLAASLLCHETPSSWQKKWDGPEDPLHYLRGVMSRALAIQKWLKLAETGSLINETLDLSELFHPDTFLNAFRQETAREIKQSMDYLKFVSNWNGPVSGSKMCLKITGLQLVGCLFDGIHLTDCKRDSPSITAVPPCFVAWIPKDFSPYQETVISLPVYFTQERERIVTCLDVPCGNSKDHWLQCGAAFLLKSS